MATYWSSSTRRSDEGESRSARSRVISAIAARHLGRQAIEGALVDARSPARVLLALGADAIVHLVVELDQERRVPERLLRVGEGLLAHVVHLGLGRGGGFECTDHRIEGP